MISFFCSTCAAKIQVEDSMKGRFVVCGRCRMQVHVPDIVVAETSQEPLPLDDEPAPPANEFVYEDPQPASRRYGSRRRRRRQRSMLPTLIGVFGSLVLIAFVALVATNGKDNVQASAEQAIAGVGGTAGALCVMFLPYFCPSFIAFVRKHHQRFAILILNLFLGWTCLFWIISLVWAFTEVNSREHVHYHY